MSKNRKIIEYKILSSIEVAVIEGKLELENEVSKYLNIKDEIWEPSGNVSTAFDDVGCMWFFQTIVRYKD